MKESEKTQVEQDNPVNKLVDGFKDIQRLKTDIFRQRVDYDEGIKNALAEARQQGVDAVCQLEQQLDPIEHAEPAVVIDLLLSYRAVRAWNDMIRLVSKMSAPLAETVMVQEQLGLALNRAGRGEEAEQVLLSLIAKHGPSSETNSILGRVYKDRWAAARAAGEHALAQESLNKAIAAYLQGFESDWRDAYPGINAVSLMELAEPPDPRRMDLLPVVRYAVERRMAVGTPDYWDHATLLELAVLAKNEARARDNLSDALASVREAWEPESTARNLHFIHDVRKARGEALAWAVEIENSLILGSKAQ